MLCNAEATSVEILQSPNDLPNISSRFHPNSTAFNVFADLVAWTAKEAGTDCWAETISANSSSLSNDLEQVHFGWDLGFRVGASCGIKHDRWDTKIFYTQFYTKGKDHVSKSPGSIHSTFLGNFYVDNPEGRGITGPSYESAILSWRIHFNMFEWELGRNFWVSKSLALRPFIGIKGGWIHQFIHSKWQNPNLPASEFFNIGIENLKNNFWGLGPEAGINTKWVLFSSQSQFFSIIADISGTIMGGHWSFSDTYKNNVFQEISINSQSINNGASMFRVVTGLEWNAILKQDLYQFSIKLGYEMQFWLNQLQYYSFTGGRLDNQLTLQGGTLGVCFDF